MSGNNCLRILAIRQISNSMSNLKIQYESETLYEINKNHIFNTVFENHWKKSHSTLRAEASYGYILSGQKFFKNAKNWSLWRVFEKLKLAVKQCYQTGQFVKDKNWWKMPKFKSSNVTIWVIFKHCELASLALFWVKWDFLVIFKHCDWVSTIC